MMNTFLGNKKGRALFAAAIAATSVGALISTPASAIDGQQFVVNGGFDSSGANGELLAPSTTDFALTSINGPGGGTGNGSMYDLKKSAPNSPNNSLRTSSNARADPMPAAPRRASSPCSIATPA